jgi:hypothetical protein
VTAKPAPGAPARHRLPIGIQTLREMREAGYLYVDKTAPVLEMVTQGKAWFLSRPRRFGKSLLLDTFKEVFEGNQGLFDGLFIHDRWDWRQTFPVIKLDFTAGQLDSRAALDLRIRRLLVENQQRLGLDCEWADNDIPGCFAQLIQGAHQVHGQPVVILVDEYDKPILDNIEQPAVAAGQRDGLKNLYSVMKAEDAHIRFIFMTGVSKFSKVSLFSGINQLNDITLDARFATLCGYTQHDLETTFGEHLHGVDRDELRRWYNGYSFLGEPVYNPFDILLFIDKGHSYRNFWFETGSPSFLLKLFQRERYFLPDLENLEVSEEILDAFDVEGINPVTLLFQTGYLTIAKAGPKLGEFTFWLKIPNQEVRIALNNQFIAAYTQIADQRLSHKADLHAALSRGDLPGLIAAIRRLFAGIPWRNFTHNDLAESEGYYASVLYAFFASLNAEIIPEDISNHGQVDLTIKLDGYIYVIEIKLHRVPASQATPALNAQAASGPVDEPPSPALQANPALTQIRARNYSAKYRGLPSAGLFEVGLVFDPRERNLIQADWLPVTNPAAPSPQPSPTRGEGVMEAVA